MGTSLTFFKGKEFNEYLEYYISERSGLPSITMTTAIVNGLKALQAKNIAVATVYSQEVTDLLIKVLKEYGLSSVNVEFLETDISEVEKVSTDRLIELGSKAAKNVKADALLISCGGLRTIEATKVLEEKLGIPVVSSAVAGAWATIRLVEDSGYAAEGGKLLQMSIK